MWVLSLLLVALVANYSPSQGHIDHFHTDLEEDGLVYSSVPIPRHSARVYVKVFLDSAVPDDFMPMILLRYNGLPTIEVHDAMYSIPRAPQVFELIDNQPSESTLFVAFWGGALPHSHRHFAGSARTVTVSMDTLIFSCETDVHTGGDCSQALHPIQISADQGSETVIQMDTGEWSRTGSLTLPKGLESVHVGVSIAAGSQQALCSAWKSGSSDSQSGSVLALVFRMYMNHPDEDQDSGRVAAVVDMHNACSSSSGGGAAARASTSASMPLQAKPLLLNVSRPYSGAWRVSVELASVKNDDAKVTKTTATATATAAEVSSRPANFIMNTPVDVKVTAQYRTCPSGWTGGDEHVLTHRFRRQIPPPVLASRGATASKYELVSSGSSSCAIPVVAMRTSRGSSSRGVVQLRSPDAVLARDWQEESPLHGGEEEEEMKRSSGTKWEYVSLKHRTSSSSSSSPSSSSASSSVMFSGSMEHLSMPGLLGGVVQIEMRVRPHVDSGWLTTKNVQTSSISSSSGQEGEGIAAVLDAQAREAAAIRALGAVGAEAVQERLQHTHFLVSLRVGARAGDATLPWDEERVARTKGGAATETFDSFSRDAIVLSTRTAKVRPLDDATAAVDEGESDEALPLPSFLQVRSPSAKPEGDDTSSFIPQYGGSGDNDGDIDAGGKAGLQYIWTLDKPALAAITGSSVHSLDSLYLRVTKVEPPVKPSSEEQEGRGEGASDNYYLSSFVTNVGINFMQCHASSCVHGQCVAVGGDVPHSSCQCKYPYGGERCEELSMSWSWYAIQVAFLVLSNLAAMPGIIASVKQRLFSLAACILLAALSSALYHLCDMDAVCLGGLSYASYQSFDVLFCLLTVGLVLLHHAPVSVDTLAALTVVLVATLLPPVVNNPTHEFTVIAALCVGGLLLLATWYNYAARLAVRRRARAKRTLTTTNTATSAAGGGGDADTDTREGIELGAYIPHRHGEEEEEREETGLLSGSRRGGGSADGGTTVMSGREQQQQQQQQQEEEEDREDEEAAAAGRVLFAENKSLASRMRFLARKVRMSLIGGVFALVGLCSFLAQTRQNYFVTHSVWHLCVMVSTYFFVCGRTEVKTYLRASVHALQAESVDSFDLNK